MTTACQHGEATSPIATLLATFPIWHTFAKQAVRPRDHDLDADALTRAMIRTCKRLNIEGASVHVFRRTAATEMGRLPVPPDIIERVLALTPSGVTMRHDNLHTYAPEKLAALTTRQDEFMRIVGQSQQSEILGTWRAWAR